MDSYPVLSVLPELSKALQEGPITLLSAPPGAGKSTVLPLELLKLFPNQKILMLEPRRLAARTVAHRLASLLGEDVGKTVGYRIRFENRVSKNTRIEILTEGILTHMLQQDPSLEGVGLVIFDEFHERSLDADLALSLSLQAQEVFRPDLKLLIMSATLGTDELSSQLPNAPLIEASGRQYPVKTEHLNQDPTAPIPATAAGAVSKMLNLTERDILIFLPGIKEISQTQNLLQARHPEILITPLYGDLSIEAQQAAILPHPHMRKVVLATSIAETSLTIEGIDCVIDSGLSRVARYDPSSGLTKLETIRVTKDAADQRAGRAGRLSAGHALRLWSANTHNNLAASRRPEILEADLSSLLLELANWGETNPYSLRWITPPPQKAVEAASKLLEQLQATSGGAITEKGKAMAGLPTHPRIAHMLMEAKTANLSPLACDIAAILEERDPLPRGSSSDINDRIELLRNYRKTKSTAGSDKNALMRIERLSEEWRRRMGIAADNSSPVPTDCGQVITWAYPDRVAQIRDDKSLRYRLSSGKGVKLNDDDALIGSVYLAVAQMDAGTIEGRIFLASPLEPNTLQALAHESQNIKWDSKTGTICATLEQKFGDLILSQRPIKQIPEQTRLEIILEVLQREGFSALNLSESAKALCSRVMSLRHWRPTENWPDYSAESLKQTLGEWLAPFLGNVSSRADLQKIDLVGALSAFLPWELSRTLEEAAPTHLMVPSGSSIELNYFDDGSPPVLAVKLQELFGLAETPTVNQGRTKVMLHLLTPAQKPIQITQDLRSFWDNTYPQIRKELRGRYNKHPWPEDPWNHIPTKKTNRNL